MTTPALETRIPSMPGAVPGLGHLPRFARDPLRFFDALRDRGDVVRWRLGRSENVFISHPRDIMEVFLNVEKTFSMESDAGYAFDLFAGQGIINTHGDFWRRQRKMMQPGMHPTRIAGYADTMVRYTDRLLRTWQAGQTRDIRVEMLRLTQQIAARTMFGADVSADASTVGQALDVASREIGAEFRGITMFIPASIVTPGRRRLRAAIGAVEQVLYRIIDDRKRADGDRPDDMLTMLVDARDDEGRPMSDRQLRDEAMTLYIAGHETTGNTLVWAYQLLSRNPQAYERMATEVATVVGDRLPTMDDYRGLKYTEAVVKETLRLYPPAWLLPVAAAVDVPLGGYLIPAGRKVWTSPWATHRDPRWFDHPAAFRPDRFLGHEAQLTPPYAWFPFGGGPHVCLGNRFALVEAVLVLATVTQRFRLAMDPGLIIDPQPLLTLQPGRDVPMQIHAAAHATAA